MEFSNTSLSFSTTEKSAFIAKTYGWMALGLFLTAIVAFFTASSMFNATGEPTAFALFLFGGAHIGFWIFSIAELVLVWWLSSSIRKVSVGTAMIGFVVYAVLNGIVLSSIFIVYQIASIASSFLGCAAMFAAMSFYGANTKKDLSTVGKYCIMALIGVIIANTVQIIVSHFTGASFGVFDFVVSIITVVIFTGLTAYDTQKLVRTAEYANGNDDYKKVSILAALELYLDFINLFLAILRLFGKRR